MTGLLATRAVGAALDFLLPRVCVACEGALAPHEPGVVCGRCWSRLPFLPNPRCTRCGHPTGGGACPFCELLPPFVRAARSVCWVPDAVGSAVVHALKYDGWTATADGMAERMSRLPWPTDVQRERAALVPVPLAPVRERERGFNQARLIAESLSRRWGIPAWSDVLRRARRTVTQTRLTREERSANVLRAFGVADGVHARVHGQHLVLVDDVITTGATLNSCAGALFDAGARTLSYVTFGRARTSRDR